MPSHISSLSPSQTTLLAATLAAAADIPRLRHLLAARPDVFTPETTVRVLLCIPETAPPASYAPILRALLEPPGEEAGDIEIETAAVDGVSEKRARRKLQLILPPPPPPQPQPDTEGLVLWFLSTRAESIDAETGALSIAAELLQLFPEARELYAGTVRVLCTLVYELQRDAPTLAAFRVLPPEAALEVLLSDQEMVVRDLRVLVEPFLESRRQWAALWTLLQKLPWGRVVEVVAGWTPPGEVRNEFARWAVRECYRCPDTAGGVWEGMHSVRKRVEALMGGEVEEGEVLMTFGEMGDGQNPLFAPTRAALGLLDVGITAAALLGRPLAETVRLRLDRDAEAQGGVLRGFVRAGTGWDRRDDEGWRKVRDGARWLRDKAGVFGQLSTEEVERTVLAGMLAGTRFALIKEVYVTNNFSCGLPLEDVEKCVLVAFNEFVDNATNGNKTRGRMKSALQAIQTLYPHASPSSALARAYSLVNAIHELSTYTLLSSTHNGTPLLPVQIRIHPDPLSLISKLLDSNPHSYQRVDALLQIGRDLVFGSGGEDREIEARVLGMCAEAALGEDDFDTAYTLISTRMLPQPGAEPAESLWRTALLAGKFQSSYAILSGSTPPRGPVALKMLEKKRTLLAWALAYCPPDTVADVLAVWSRNEEETEAAMEAEEEEKRGAVAAVVEREEVGPQSLFEVAKGAAKVFSAVGGGEEKRERKRDVVGGMVTRGLAGGLGWVLGAQPNIEGGERR